MLKIAEERAKAGQQSAFGVARWKYFAKESERMLGKPETRILAERDDQHDVPDDDWWGNDAQARWGE